MREFDAFGQAFGAAGEKDDGGVVRLQVVGFRLQVERAPEQREKSFSVGDVFAHVLQVNQCHAGLDEWLRVELGTLEEGPRSNDSLQTGQLHAREHRRRAGRVVQYRRDFVRGPETEQHDRRGADVWKKDADAFVGRCAEKASPLGGHQIDAHHQAAVADRLARRVFDHHEPGPEAGSLGNGGQDSAWSLLHFDAELLRHHFIAQPVGERVAGLGGAGVFQVGRRERLAEVGGHAREPLLEIFMHRQPLLVDAAQIAGNDLGARLVQQKTGAVEQLHQRTGAGEPPFRKQHEPPAGLQIFRHPLERVGRCVVDEKCAAVDRYFAVQPARLRRDAGDDKFPIVVQAHAQEQPINERLMVGDQQHRAGCGEHILVVGPEPEKPSHQQTKKGFHNLEDLLSSALPESQRTSAVVTKTESGASQ